MKRSIKNFIAGGVAVLTTGAIAVGSMLAFPFFSKPASASLIDFDADPGAYDLWDGVSYDFSWYGDGSLTSYEISTAAQLASLSILTNDLSSDEWNGVTANVSESDRSFIKFVDDFEGKTIKITRDIDLGDYDWTPISYPWRTPDLSSTYEFVNLAGETVTYNAVDHVPELETVDPWVGDENGNPISTRYWELPESEMRFRDLIRPVNFDSMNELVDGKLEAIGAIAYADVDRDGLLPFSAELRASYDYNYTYVKPRDYDWDIIKSYAYKDIRGYTEIPAFSGTLDGSGHRVKGVSPKTPWTDDADERLHTYDPIAKAFVSRLGIDGSIKNLNVQGSYDNEIMSYSSILCAYNHGNISICCVEGKKIEQALITMKYPRARDYSPNHDSTYLLSDTPGTVLPVGNSGIITSQNYGVITGCISNGIVVQAYRQFGGVACANYGTIDTCANYAVMDSYDVETDFITDEWSYGGIWGTFYSFTGNSGMPIDGSTNTFNVYLDGSLYDRRKKYYADSEDYAGYATPVSSYAYAITPDSDSIYGWAGLSIDGVSIEDSVYNYIRHTWLMSCSNLYSGVRGYNFYNPTDLGSVLGEGNFRFNWNDAVAYNGSFQDVVAWIPDVYDTNEGESIAANHIYGVYTMTAVGGICAVNEGKVISCVNNADITALRNITDQSNYNRYGSWQTAADGNDYYSYIRAGNAYGIFCTAVNTVSYASGICAYNEGDISGCGNFGDISYPGEYSSSVRPHSSIGRDHSYSSLDFIPATRNNFYQNMVRINKDVKITDPNSCALWSTAWWMTEDWVAENAPGGVYRGIVDGCPYEINVSEYFDRNMPYPFAYRSDAYRVGMASGIACTNIGTVHDIETAGTAQDSVISISDGMDKAIDVYNVNTVSESRAFRNITNTNFNNVSATGADSFAVNLLQRGDVYVESNDIYITDTTDTKDEIVNINGDDVDKFIFNRVSFKKTNEQAGAALATTITRATVSELVNQSSYGSPGYMDTVKLTNYYVVDTNGIKNLLEGVNCEISNVYANIGSAEKLCQLENTILSNMQVYGDGATPVGEFYGCVMSNVDIFGDNATMTCEDCDISRFMSIGTIAADTYTTSTRYDYWDDKKFDTDHYVYYFKNTTANDMYLESEIDYALVGFNQPGFSYNNVPGVVAILNNTEHNGFTHCSINAPDGVLSYSYPNHLILDEVNDAYGILYSDHAARDGSMAYALTNGDRKFTVAANDIVARRDAWFEFGLSELQDWCEFAISDLDLPIHTRECSDDSEETYHKLSVPYVSYGVGELIVSREENGEIFATHATNEMFPHTDIFTKAGERIKVSVEAEDKYALNGVSEHIEASERKISSEGANDEPYRITSYVMGNNDVTLIGDWVNVHDIETDISVENILDIVANAKAAAKGQLISVSGILHDDAWTIDGFYYICYKTDGSNRIVLDPSTRTEIGADCKFVMPDAAIRIYAKLSSNLAGIKKFVISGQDAVISGNNIDAYFDDSINISNLTVDDYIISDGAVISPDPRTVSDFSKPVVFTVTSESGYAEIPYVVTAHPVEDGKIERFQVNGYNGIIRGTEITVNVPLDMDVSKVRPYVVWSGTAILPDITHVYDFNTPKIFKVRASNGTITEYTVTVNKTDVFESPLQSFEIDGMITEIDHSCRRIFISYPYGMDVSDIILSDISYIGASSSLQAGQRINLTQAAKLAVVDMGGNVVSYTIIATEENPSMHGILQFNLYGQDAVIDDDTGTITIDLPDYLDKSNIAPYVVTFLGKELSPSATVKQDFNSPVQYTVTSYTGETKTYTVIVT